MNPFRHFDRTPLGVKRLGREADHSPQSSADVKNSWSYTSTPPTRLHGVTLTLTSLDGGSAHRKVSTYTGQHNTEKRVTSMSFEPHYPIHGQWDQLRRFMNNKLTFRLLLLSSSSSSSSSLITGFLSPVLLLLNQWCIPPVRLQVSDCSTFLIKCNVPSTCFFFLCRESTECFPGIFFHILFIFIVL